MVENKSLVVTVYDDTGRKVISQDGVNGMKLELDLFYLLSGTLIVTVEYSKCNKKYKVVER
ncbi:MAG: hypothetical protein R2863_12090 [Candidatus Kapaibacterium sp.]|nr:hypothetical protein [Romboutsia sp.]